MHNHRIPSENASVGGFVIVRVYKPRWYYSPLHTRLHVVAYLLCREGKIFPSTFLGS